MRNFNTKMSIFITKFAKKHSCKFLHHQAEPYHVTHTEKSSEVFCFFLVLSLFYRSQKVNFKEIYHFSRFKRGSYIFQGGSNFFQVGGGGSNCLFPIETHITCDFPGGGGSGPLVPPSGSALVNVGTSWGCGVSHFVSGSL